MKRFWSLTAALLLLFCLAMPGYAAEAPLTMTDADVQLGQTVYLTISLNQSVQGDTMGITYSYDTSKMKVIPSECQWKKSSVLKDFSTSSCNGVWAAGKVTNLQGDICVLAFQVLPGQTFANSQVECELMVKQGAQEVGRYEASAAITVSCSHSYGNWEPSGDALHTRSCTSCGAAQSQSHSWGEETAAEDPENPAYNIMTSRCSVCSGTKIRRIPGEAEEIKPILPEATVPAQHPTEPSNPTVETIPLPTAPLPTYPTPQPTEKATAPTVPETPTGSTAPTVPSGAQQSQQNTQPQSTQPTFYQPRDYNTPEETEERESVEQQPYIYGAEQVLPNITGEKPAEKTAPAVMPIGEENHLEASEQTGSTQPVQAENQSYGPVLIIAVVSVLGMVLVPWLEKKNRNQ